MVKIQGVWAVLHRILCYLKVAHFGRDFTANILEPTLRGIQDRGWDFLWCNLFWANDNRE